MNILLKVILVAIVLTGCASNQPVAPKEVYIPVVAPVAEPPVEVEPTLPIWMLKDTDASNYRKISNYYVRSLIIQRAYADKLQCALDAYRTVTPKQCKVVPEEK